MRRIWWTMVMLAGLVGCAELRDLETPASAKQPLDDNITKLINGRFTFERPEVGRLQWNGSACTGTLIRPNVVLTAAHCVGWSTNDGQGRPLGTFFIHKSAQQVFQYAFDAHIAYDVAFEQGGQPARDIALLRLIQNVPATVATPTRISAQAPAAGTAVTLMGYGCGDRSNTSDANQGRKQKLPIQQGRSTNLCPGDSGGPTIVDADGTVFQVNSAYDGGGTDLFGDAVAMAATLNAQADQWSNANGGGQQQAPPQGGDQLSCRGLFDCLTGCNGEVACQQDCARRTAADPRRRYDAVVACSQANRCPDFACVERECADQVTACFDAQPEPQPQPEPEAQPDPEQPEPQPQPDVGQLSCLDLIDCGTRCAGDRGCFNGCWGQATADARAAYQSYADCSTANDCRDAACAERMCGGEYAACTGRAAPDGGAGGDNDGGNGGAALACGTVLQCIESCAWNDQQCHQNCYFQGTPEAQVRYNQLATCAMANFCGDRGCLQMVCTNELSMCVTGQGAPPANGCPQGGCPQGGCPGGCPQGGCPGGCPQGGCPQGGCPGGCPQGGCPQGGCPGGCPQGGCPQGGCPQGGCPQGSQGGCGCDCGCGGQCGGDCGCGNCGCGNGAAGNWQNVANGLTCGQIVGCLETCGNNAACQNSCYSQGSPQAQQQLDALYGCAAAVGCQDYNCVERACGAQLAACF